MKHTREALIQHGHELKKFTESKAYAALLDVLEEDYRTSLFDTPHTENETREEIYRRFHVLQDIKGTINALVHAAVLDAELKDAEEYEFEFE